MPNSDIHCPRSDELGPGIAQDWPPLHVALVYWDPFTPGGVQSQVAGRLDHLGAPGGPVRYTLFSKQAPPQPHPWPHVRTEVFSGWDRFSIAVSEWTAARSLARALDRVHRQDPFDLIDLHAGGAGPAVAAWSGKTGVPYVFVSHSLRFFNQKDHGMRWEVAWYYHWSNRKAARGARHVIAVSNALKGELVRFGVPADKIDVQHTAVRPAATISDHPVGRPLRLLFVGRVTPDKGLDLLLDAVAICTLKRKVELFLTVVGQVSPDDPLCRKVSEGNLPVRFAGACSNERARRLIAEHDVLVVPSRYDPCPVVVIEGLNAGTVVVGTRVGGIPEMIQDGRTGILVPPQAGALADAVCQLGAAPDRMDELRRAAWEAGRQFLWETRAREVLASYLCCARPPQANAARGN
jgi:glycosyltransferase involved in cell wall biosynthesis